MGFKFNPLTGTLDLVNPTGSGDVIGPVSAVDNAVTRFDGPSGNSIQSSNVDIDDAGNVFIKNGAPSAPSYSAEGNSLYLSSEGTGTVNDQVVWMRSEDDETSEFYLYNSGATAFGPAGGGLGTASNHGAIVFTNNTNRVLVRSNGSVDMASDVNPGGPYRTDKDSRLTLFTDGAVDYALVIADGSNTTTASIDENGTYSGQIYRATNGYRGTVAGGSFDITVDAVTGATQGGSVSMSGGSSENADAGQVNIGGGSSSTLGNGGSVVISGGTAEDGTGGPLEIATGGVTGTGASGEMLVYTGEAADGNTGPISVYTSDAVDSNSSGNIALSTGDTVDGNPGEISMSAGSASGTGNGGELILNGGGATSGQGGKVEINAGSTTSGAPGYVSLNAGFNGTILGDVNIMARRTIVASGMVHTVRVVTAAGTVTVAADDYLVAINKTVGAATTVDLPTTPDTGFIVIIKDAKGDALVNNITIDPTGGTTIDGAATQVINTNYGSMTLMFNGTEYNLV